MLQTIKTTRCKVILSHSSFFFKNETLSPRSYPMYICKCRTENFWQDVHPAYTMSEDNSQILQALVHNS